MDTCSSHCAALRGSAPARQASCSAEPPDPKHTPPPSATHYQCIVFDTWAREGRRLATSAQLRNISALLGRCDDSFMSVSEQEEEEEEREARGRQDQS